MELLNLVVRHEFLLSLRFVAAGCVPSSGDKSDKEESADGFRCYGDCVSGLWRRCAELQGLSAQTCWSFWSDVAGRCFSLAPSGLSSACFGALVAVNGPAPPDGGAEGDDWIMRHAPMAARATSGFGCG